MTATLKCGTPGDFIIKVSVLNGHVEFTGLPDGFYGYSLGDDADADGVFVRWAFQNNRLQLSTDRLGLYPIYYLQHENQLMLSNSIELIRQHQPLTLDTEAVAIFFRLGFYLGQRTAFKGLCRPNGQLQVSVSAGGLELSISRPTQSQVDNSDFEQQYCDLMHHALQPLVGQTPALYMPLTGGKDSRHIFLSLRQAGLKPDCCYTVSVLAPHYNDDQQVAQQLCQRTALMHQALAAETKLISSEQRKNLLTNFETRDHSWATPVARYLDTRPAGIVLDGFGGDVLSQSSIVTPEMHSAYHAEDWERLVKLIARPNQYNNSWLTEAYQDFIIDERVLAEQLLAELKSFTGTVNPVAQFYFWNRSRRTIAISSIRFMTGRSLAYFPFMQQQLVDFLFSLPPALYFSGSFHSRVLQRLAGDLATVPFAASEQPGDTLSWWQWSRLVLAVSWELLNNRVIRPRLRIKGVLQALASITDRKKLVSFVHFYRKLGFLNQLIRYVK